jgi:hypothetical protein
LERIGQNNEKTARPIGTHQKQHHACKCQNELSRPRIFTIARVDNDQNYNSHRREYKIRSEVDRLLEATGVDLSRGGGIPELESFQHYFHDRYKIVVYTGLRYDLIIYESKVDAPKRTTFLFDKENNM